MAFSLSHPIYRKITDQYYYLRDLIEMSTNHMDDVYKQEEKEGEEWAEKNAKEQAGEDQDIYYSAISSNWAAVECHLEDLHEVQSLLHISLFNTVYSYFESIATLIIQNKGLGAGIRTIECISSHYASLLSPGYSEQLNYLKDTIRIIRDLLTHNCNGSNPPYENQLKVAKIESERKIGFIVEEGRRYSVTKEYVMSTLEIEYRLLLDIARIEGYV